MEGLNCQIVLHIIICVSKFSASVMVLGEVIFSLKLAIKCSEGELKLAQRTGCLSIYFMGF